MSNNTSDRGSTTTADSTANPMQEPKKEIRKSLHNKSHNNHDIIEKERVYKGKEDPHYGTMEDSVDYVRPSVHELYRREFYQQEGWFDLLCEALFKIKGRKTTIKAELYHGVVHFISCLYCLAVVPQQLNAAGYNNRRVVVAVALCCGVGSIFCGIFANLPFVMAPPTVVTIFQSVFLQQNNLGPRAGNFGVVISGVLLMCFGWRPLADFVRRVIPIPIQVGTAVGIGLLTSLAGSTEINLVIAGEYKILRMGHITPEIVITFVGVFLICIAMRFHVKGSFCIGVAFCSITWWIYDRSFPSSIFAAPEVTTAKFNDVEGRAWLPLLSIDLLFLYILYLNGLVSSLSNLGSLTRKDSTTPRGRWIFFLSGLFTVIGGLLTSVPILVSPESSAAIKEGARTGLSTVVCGILFLFSAFLSPVFENVPATGTSPVLIMIGLILFQNVNRIEWRNIADAVPAFLVLFYIPFTYSVLQGVILGYIMYLAITLCTGELFENFFAMLLFYFPHLEPRLQANKYIHRFLPGNKEAAHEGEEGEEYDDDSIADDGSSVAPSDSSSRQSPATLGKVELLDSSYQKSSSAGRKGGARQSTDGSKPGKAGLTLAPESPSAVLGVDTTRMRSNSEMSALSPHGTHAKHVHVRGENTFTRSQQEAALVLSAAVDMAPSFAFDGPTLKSGGSSKQKRRGSVKYRQERSESNVGGETQSNAGSNTEVTNNSSSNQT